MKEKGWRPFWAALLAALLVRASSTGREEVVFSPEDREGAGKAAVARANELLAKEAAPELPLGDGVVANLLNKVAAGVSAFAQGTAMLAVSEETRDISGGFILKDGRIEVNCTFDALVRAEREQTAGEVAKLLFPEYYESYDEIGPAHIFELNLTGEGFRARQCFKEGVILLNAYDEIFPQACVEESAEVLIPMAWNRLYAACGLSPEARAAYETYVREQSGKVLTILLKKRELKPLHFFFEKGYGRKKQIEDAVAIASHEEWMEGVASLIAWKRQLFAEPEKTADVKSRYSFEEF